MNSKSLFGRASVLSLPSREIFFRFIHPLRTVFCGVLLAFGSAWTAHAQDRELHVVGIYAASPESVANHSEGVVSVIVNRPGKVVTLVLSAYEPTLWQLNVGAGTTIEKVYVTGYYRQRTQGVPTGAQVVPQSYETGNGYLLVGDRIDSRQFLASVPKIFRLTGMEMSSFNGNHVSNEPMVFTIDSVQDDPRLRTDYPQPVPIGELPNVEFQMAFEQGENVVLRDYTLAGARNTSSLMPDGMRVIAETTKRFYFGAERHTVLKFDTVNGTVEEIAYSIVAPEGWPMGTAFDSKRGRVVVVSLGSEGFLYANTPPSTQWTFLASADNRDYEAIDYHAANDSYYALGTTYESAPVIHHLSAAGLHLDGEIRLPLQPFNGYDERSEIVSVGNYIVVLFGPGRYVQPDEFPESRMYLVDPATGQSWLTYRKVGRPVNRPPSVQMVAPDDGASFEVGMAVLLRAAASDSDGAIDSVEFFADNQSLGNGTVAGDGRFERTWTPSAPGSYLVTARATDQEGQSSFATAIHIIIEGNLPPTVRIRALNGRLSFPPGTAVQLVADASDSDGTVKKVEFFIDGTRIGEAASTGGTAYQVAWTTPNGGSYTLTAKATDDEGVTATSPPVSVLVRENSPPRVRILSPVNGATLRSGATVQLTAEAFDFDGDPSMPPFTTNAFVPIIDPSLNVEFFLNDASIGIARSVGGIMYRLNWIVPAPGTYTLRAKATDRDGATTVSAPVEVTVVDAPVVVLRHLARAYRPGERFRVRLTVEAASTLTSLTIEDKIPAGWTVTRVSRGGTFDPATGTVRFGPFSESRRGVFGYQVEVPLDATGVKHFAGSVTADGVILPIGGKQTIGPVGEPRKTAINGLILRPTLLRGPVLAPLPSEVPAANVLIWISDDSTRPAVSVRTDGNGRFHAETFLPGTVHITVPALPAGESNLLPGFTLPATEEKTVDVNVRQNEVVDVTIHLVAANIVGEPRLIYSVEKITLAAVDFPTVPTLLVSARGTARSSGWANPQLRRRTPVIDGIVEFDFLATPSDGIVLPVISPISATVLLELPPDFRGVRVYAETNSQQVLFPQP
jgi:hypothetical protein